MVFRRSAECCIVQSVQLTSGKAWDLRETFRKPLSCRKWMVMLFAAATLRSEENLAMGPSGELILTASDALLVSGAEDMDKDSFQRSSKPRTRLVPPSWARDRCGGSYNKKLEENSDSNESLIGMQNSWSLRVIRQNAERWKDFAEKRS